VPGDTCSAFTFSTSLAAKSVVDLVVHEQAVRADAGLPAVAVLGCHRALDRGIQVGIVEDDERRIAAQLQRNLLHRRRRLLHQQAPDLGRARKGDLAYRGIGAELAADRRRIAGEDVEHALGKAGALGELGEREGRQRRLLGRLEHHGASGRKRGRHLARDHRVGEVPRRNRRAHAYRLLHDDDAPVRPRRRDGVAVDALGLLGEPLDVGGADLDFAFRFRERLALLGSEQQREVVLIRNNQLGPLAQNRRAFLAGLRAPGGQRALGRFDGAPRFRGAEVRHAAELLARGRVVHGKGLLRIGADPGAIEVALLAEKLRILEGRRQAGLVGAFIRISGSIQQLAKIILRPAVVTVL
jgi:ParB family chromosome partitioning protein